MMKPRIAKIAARRGDGSKWFCRRLELGGGCWLLALTAAAQSFDVLFTFPDVDSSPGGGNPSSLMLGSNGNFYGTCVNLGAQGWGAVYQISPYMGITPVYSFTNGSSYDGSTPYAGLAQGTNGLFYGMAQAGGSNGCGTVFEVKSSGTFTSLYSFSPGTNYPGTGGVENEYNADGINPKTILLGSDNDIYGVAYYGGANGAGSIFQLAKGGGLTVVHAFDYVSSGANSDGGNPISLLQGPNGNLYGTAYEGGSNAFGTFFTIGLPPVITAQPTNQAVALHGAARFSVAASNALGCQWQFNGGDLPNATNYTLSITNVLLPDAGSYQAVMTNRNGATASSVVTLAITNLPVSFVAGALEYGGGQFSLELTNLAGQGAVVIEASGDLRQWTPIYTNPAGFGTAQFIDTTAGSNAFRFYRAWTP
jgi:uncharacterized repeat protein (TIGR03803 family)